MVGRLCMVPSWALETQCDVCIYIGMEPLRDVHRKVTYTPSQGDL